MKWSEYLSEYEYIWIIYPSNIIHHHPEGIHCTSGVIDVLAVINHFSFLETQLSFSLVIASYLWQVITLKVHFLGNKRLFEYTQKWAYLE